MKYKVISVFSKEIREQQTIKTDLQIEDAKKLLSTSALALAEKYPSSVIHQVSNNHIFIKIGDVTISLYVAEESSNEELG